jgi:hypothetical protein
MIVGGLVCVALAKHIEQRHTQRAQWKAVDDDSSPSPDS